MISRVVAGLHGYRYGKAEKIKRGSKRQFPPPLLPLWREAIIADKRVIGQSVRFRALFRLPNLTKFYQFLPKTCSERERRWQLRALNGGFSRPIYLNPVKSGGSCQALAEIGFWVLGVRGSQNNPGSGLGVRGLGFAESRHWFAIFFCEPRTPNPDLLILGWLLANPPSRSSHDMLNLKDLTSKSPESVDPPLGVSPGE